MRFEKTAHGWRAYRKVGRAYIYFGHFPTQRAAREALTHEASSSRLLTYQHEV